MGAMEVIIQPYEEPEENKEANQDAYYNAACWSREAA